MKRGAKRVILRGLALSLALAAAPAESGNDEGQTNRNGQLMLDPEKVLELQMQAIDAQADLAGTEGIFIGPRSRFARRTDEFHKRWYCRMDNAVRRVDTMWLTEEIQPYDYELSTFKLKTLARVGGRGNDKEYEVKVRFSADVALPGLEKKLHLFVDNAGRDTLPGKDPMEKEADTRLGARAIQPLRLSELDLGGGLRWRNSGPVVFADLDWRWKWDLKGGKLRLTPRGFWYSDEGFGQTTTLAWTRPTSNPRKIFQFIAAERSTEKTDGVEFEQSLRFAWLRSGRVRGWVAQASVFPHLVSSDWIWDDSLITISWRDALYRKWIYYTVTPQVEFPKEDDYHARPSIRMGVEILFGGKIGELI